MGSACEEPGIIMIEVRESVSLPFRGVFQVENYNFQRERTRGCAPCAPIDCGQRDGSEAKNKTREKPYINETVSGLDSALESDL